MPKTLTNHRSRKRARQDSKRKRDQARNATIRHALNVLADSGFTVISGPNPPRNVINEELYLTPLGDYISAETFELLSVVTDEAASAVLAVSYDFGGRDYPQNDDEACRDIGEACGKAQAMVEHLSYQQLEELHGDLCEAVAHVGDLLAAVAETHELLSSSVNVSSELITRARRGVQ